MNYARGYLMREIEVSRNVTETHEKYYRAFESDSWNGRSRVLLYRDGLSHEIIKKYSSYIISITHDLCCTNVERIFPKNIAREIYIFRVCRCKDARVFSYRRIKRRKASQGVLNSAILFCASLPCIAMGNLLNVGGQKYSWSYIHVHLHVLYVFYVSRIFGLATWI